MDHLRPYSDVVLRCDSGFSSLFGPSIVDNAKAQNLIITESFDIYTFENHLSNLDSPFGNAKSTSLSDPGVVY